VVNVNPPALEAGYGALVRLETLRGYVRCVPCLCLVGLSILKGRVKPGKYARPLGFHPLHMIKRARLITKSPFFVFPTMCAFCAQYPRSGEGLRDRPYPVPLGAVHRHAYLGNTVHR
jgi:hypothetical protein